MNINMINLDFNVPFYIFEEIVEYIQLKSEGTNKITKRENIKSLIRCAVVNNRLTEEQANIIRNMLVEK